eukprot:scaffold108734_cov38-Attheya_sp.AAC.2
MDPDDTNGHRECGSVVLLHYCHCACLIQITDDGSYGTVPSQGMDPDDTNGHRECGILVYCLDVEFLCYCFATHGTCLIQITDDGSYGTTSGQGMDPDDTTGHH